MKKIILTLSVIGLSLLLSAQMPGSIKGKVFSASDKMGLPNATVTVVVKGTLTGTLSDLNGNFTIKPLPAGLYELEIRYTGYETKILSGIRVNPGQITFTESVSLKEGISLDPVVITPDFELIEIDDPTKLRLDGKVLDALPERRNIPTMLAYISSSFKVSEDGKTVNVRGSRNGDAIYIVDGVKVKGGDLSVPGGAIGSMTVYASGVPAAYGDFTGGVIIIETKSYFDWVVEQKIKEYARNEAEESDE